MKRAYSVLNIKSVDEEKRIIEGIATTPTPDRVNDVVVPEGIEFSLPFPFLYQHNSSKPIGTVAAAKLSPDGMFIKVQIAAAGVAQFIDEAWALIKAGLVRGLSIGFRSLEESFDRELGGYRFLRTEIYEVSAVTIPANAEASITSIKSADCEQAALGDKSRKPVRLDPKFNHPGVTGQKKAKEMKPIAEQIAGFEAKRAASVARQTEIMNKAAEDGRTLDETETQEFDGLASEVKTIDEHLVRLKAHEKQILATATPITDKTVAGEKSGSDARSGIVTVKGPSLPLGTGFVRYAMALMAARGNRQEAFQAVTANKSWEDTTPQVANVLRVPDQIMKTAVAAGTTLASGWASQLADYTYMASEFIEYLRPMTIIGKVPGLRRVPFNITIPLQDAGASVSWVGEGAVKPLTKLNFDTINFRFAKAAGIVVLTDELVRFSNPSAEALVRTDLANAITQFLDEQFIQPAITATPNVSPASITNGANSHGASGTDAADFRTDIGSLLGYFLAANISPAGSVLVMTPGQAVALAIMTNVIGQPEFPTINADGGSIMGYNVVTSQSCTSGVVSFFKPSEILLADDGGIQIDASREASIMMDDGSSPTTATVVSMFQYNKVALRVERVINWARRRDDAVAYLSGCNYHQ